MVSVKSHTPLNAGYSGTPLAKTLGIAAGWRVCVLHAPGDYCVLVAPWPEGATRVDRADRSADLVHLFVVVRRELRAPA